SQSVGGARYRIQQAQGGNRTTERALDRWDAVRREWTALVSQWGQGRSFPVRLRNAQRGNKSSARDLIARRAHPLAIAIEEWVSTGVGSAGLSGREGKISYLGINI